MEQCQSLKELSFYDLEMEESHCRVLGGFSRPGLDTGMSNCKLTAAGTSALVEVLGRNQGPNGLVHCDMDNVVLANGLRGNSRLEVWKPHLPDNCDDGNQEVLAIAGALQENKGLFILNLMHDFTMNDESWDAVCDSLKTHPTLEVLFLLESNQLVQAPLAPAVITSRIQAVVDMLKINTSIHTMHLRDHYKEHELFRQSVIPYLETNRLRPRLVAIQQTRPIPYRAKVLGRALLAARTDANSFWMLLSGNAEVAFPSTTGTTTPAANLPTPTAASNVASAASTPSAGEKRKARP
jgi:hypothetical protein